jgi:hypothetical protein
MSLIQSTEQNVFAFHSTFFPIDSKLPSRRRDVKLRKSEVDYPPPGWLVLVLLAPLVLSLSKQAKPKGVEPKITRMISSCPFAHLRGESKKPATPAGGHNPSSSHATPTTLLVL